MKNNNKHEHITKNSVLPRTDIEIYTQISNEEKRQNSQIELIASENFTSLAVMEAAGSVLTNKYAEGYPGRRYYGGCEFVDEIESIAISRLKELFSCDYVNVQPHSGSQANQAIFLALLSPGDRILGMDLSAGGHLTHGSSVNLSGKWFDISSYGVSKHDGRIDMSEVKEIALKTKPKLIIAGGSAYARTIDFKAFREIADLVGAYLMVDMAHFAGLVAGKVLESPIPYADVVTSTTHKTLRGPRGGIILTNDLEIAKKINSAVFPGLQGGPLMHIIAAKAVAFKEAMSPEFRLYVNNVINNAKALASSLQGRGIDLVTGGTDTHLILVDLSSKNGVTGARVELLLEKAGMTCNKNSIPYDTLPPKETSGIRLGSAAATTKGLNDEDFYKVGQWIADIIDYAASNDANNDNSKATSEFLNNIHSEIQSLCEKRYK